MFKREGGITTVSLIISIVVICILAMISIRVVIEQEYINHSEEAVDTIQNTQETVENTQENILEDIM
ncbi:MAG: hypothetical protein Q4G05_02825 [Clostridia bacterium]|nr:hypothetical protein [Clostridia bacterium]